MTLQELLREINNETIFTRGEIKMYDKKRDCIIVSISPSTCRIEMNHDMLEDLREALGLKKLSDCKYTIKVANGNEDYLNVHVISGDVTIDDSYENSEWKSHFTQAEINELKQRDDLAIDWDKAIINPVED